MSRLAVLLLAAALATGCPSTGPGAAGVAAPTTGASTGMAIPIDLAVPATVLFVDLFDQVVPVGCASPGAGIHSSADGCAELLGSDRAATDFAGTPRALGEPFRATCEDTGESFPAFRIDAPPPEPATEPDELDGLVVWPPTRAPALIGWTRGPVLPSTDPAFDLAEDLRGLLIADIDGDRTLDRVFSLTSRVVLGELSSRPGERITLWESDFEDLAAFAAIDLDGDGRAEVLIGAPYATGDSLTLARFEDGELVAVSGWGCGS